MKVPPTLTPIDDLNNKLEGLHICGFFRAIGSSLDCLGGTIVGVLALATSLRRSDIGRVESALPKTNVSGNPGIQMQVEFRDFFEDVKHASGPEDWLVWTTQYRNMFVHRGRRSTRNQIVDRNVGLYDANDRLIPRFTTTLHLANYPDKSEAEAMILEEDIVLNEDADITVRGVFKSCRDLEENICERLVHIWQERRNNPQLLEQPVSQWDDVSKPCTFDGYEPGTKPLKGDLYMSHPILRHRQLAGSLDDAHRELWQGSKWDQ